MAEKTKFRITGEEATSFVRAIGHDPNLCLRSVSDKSTCQACMDVCPGHAVRLPKDAAFPGGTKVSISKGFCVDCGLCCSACPTGAMTVLEPTPRRLRHLLKRAQAAVGGNSRHVYLTCIETGLAKEDPSVVEVPCLGALTREAWASLMLDFPNLCVYLPGDLCPRCKAKAAEEIIVNEVCAAQDIVGRDLTLVELRKELDFTDSKGKLLSESDEPFGDIVSGFTDIAKDLTKGEEDMTEEERGQSDARKTRVRLRKEMTVAEGETTPGIKGAEGLTGTMTAARATLLDAVMRFPQIAPRAELAYVSVDASKLGEGDEAAALVDAVVAGCPLGAAHKAEDGSLQINRLICADCGLCAQILPEGAVEKHTVRCADLLLNEPAPAAEAPAEA